MTLIQMYNEYTSKILWNTLMSDPVKYYNQFRAEFKVPNVYRQSETLQ